MEKEAGRKAGGKVTLEKVFNKAGAPKQLYILKFWKCKLEMYFCVWGEINGSFKKCCQELSAFNQQLLKWQNSKAFYTIKTWKYRKAYFLVFSFFLEK